MSSLLAAKRKLLEEDNYGSFRKNKSVDKSVEKKHKHKKEKKSKKHKKSKKKHKKSSSESSSDTDSDNEWVEKPDVSKKNEPVMAETPRDDWMSMTGAFKTFSREDIKKVVEKKEENRLDSYDPSKCDRELNPYWKNGGMGVPSERQISSRDADRNHFKKPSHSESSRHDKYGDHRSHRNNYSSSSGNWRKKSDRSDKERRRDYSDDEKIKERDYDEKSSMDITPNLSELQKDDSSIPCDYLSDEQMNKLGAKIVKAEICGDSELVANLTSKIEKAREFRKLNPGAAPKRDDAVMLTITDSRGNTRPLSKPQHSGDYRSKGGKKKAETHSFSGERVRFFADDDKYSLKEMFEREKYGTGDDSKEEFINAIAKHKNPNDDLDDIFAEKITKNKDDAKIDKLNLDRAIAQHKSIQKTLEYCLLCVDSERMNKKMIVSLGTSVYVALPERMSLVDNHCIISTNSHLPCSTCLDEDVWSEIMAYRRALTNMFNSQNEDVIFFETVSNLHKHPHMVIHCVPLPRDVGDMSSIYFKKALLECETEWSNNKKVIELKGRDVRKGVPKGLPYFWVDFGMDPGFAHVIEDQQLFPQNFAQEIVGGMLDLDHSLWRKPHRENFELQRKKVINFSKLWKSFDPNAK